MRSFDEDDEDSDDSEGEFADEGDWYASLIAGERVGEWLDVIEEETKQQRSNDDEEKEEEEEGRRNRRRTKDDDDKRFRSAIEQLTKHVEEDEVYGEEAEVAEAERILSEALAKVSLTTNIDDDEEEIEKETSSSSSVQKLLRQSLEAIETHRKRKKNVKTYAMKTDEWKCRYWKPSYRTASGASCGKRRCCWRSSWTIKRENQKMTTTTTTVL